MFLTELCVCMASVCKNEFLIKRVHKNSLMPFYFFALILYFGKKCGTGWMDGWMDGWMGRLPQKRELWNPYSKSKKTLPTVIDYMSFNCETSIKDLLRFSVYKERNFLSMEGHGLFITFKFAIFV